MIETGNLKLEETEIDAVDLLGACVRLVWERARSNGLELITDFPKGDPPILRLDGRKFKQIVINLLSNAIKFTPRQGRVTLRFGVSDETGTVLEVTDTGIGMAAADIPKALERFQQVDGTLTRRFDGTGLGLPLSRALAELHGGTLDLESRVGVGTTVTVRLPAERIVTTQYPEDEPGALPMIRAAV